MTTKLILARLRRDHGVTVRRLARCTEVERRAYLRGRVKGLRYAIGMLNEYRNRLENVT